jgi:hypothetical protein
MQEALNIPVNVDEPLPVIVVAAAEEVLVLRMLLRQAVPMLKRPQDFGQDTRRTLATTISLALAGMDVSLEEGGDEE